MAEIPTLFVCHGDNGGPRMDPCRRVQEALPWLSLCEVERASVLQPNRRLLWTKSDHASSSSTRERFTHDASVSDDVEVASSKYA
jgi:hypothetical protein